MKKILTEHFKIMPHIADVRLSVTSLSLAGLFRNALLGMNEILKKGSSKKSAKKLSYKIQVSSFDTTSLLIDFLSDVLTLSHIKRVIFHRVNFSHLSDKHLIAKVSGSKVKWFDKDIKAVSYHQAEIIRDKKGHYQTNIVFDI